MTYSLDTGSGSPLQVASDVLNLFREHGSMTRADVIRRSGLARSTVQQRLDALLQAELIRPTGEEAPTRGRPASQFSFNHDRGVLLVADVGATGLRAALCDLRGTIKAELDCAVDVATGPQHVLTAANELFDQLLSHSGRDTADVLGIGVDVPGPVDFASGQVISPPIMTGWDRYDIPAWFAAHYSATVLVDNDVNAMAFGEQRTHYRHVENVLMLKVGTGVGAGLILGGNIHRGADGSAGDIGHVHLTVPDTTEEPLCRCGNTGCVEAYTSGWALVRDLGKAGADVKTVDEVVSLIRSGDPLAVGLARRTGRILGDAIAEAVSLLNPRVVVVGGQLAHAEDQLFAGMREVVYRRSLPLATRNLAIVPSRLDRRAGLIGMALLLADTLFATDRIETLAAR